MGDQSLFQTLTNAGCTRNGSSPDAHPRPPLVVMLGGEPDSRLSKVGCDEWANGRATHHSSSTICTAIEVPESVMPHKPTLAAFCCPSHTSNQHQDHWLARRSLAALPTLWDSALCVCDGLQHSVGAPGSHEPTHERQELHFGGRSNNVLIAVSSRHERKRCRSEVEGLAARTA